jgi:hypothetical protein
LQLAYKLPDRLVVGSLLAGERSQVADDPDHALYESSPSIGQRGLLRIVLDVTVDVVYTFLHLMLGSSGLATFKSLAEIKQRIL